MSLPTPSALFLSQIGMQSLVFSPAVTSLNPQATMWPALGTWMKKNASYIRVLCLVITRKSVYQPVRSCILYFRQLSQQWKRISWKGDQCNINESQLSQDWAAREHKWGPISTTQFMITLAVGTLLRAGGLFSGGIFQALAVNLATPQRADFCCSALKAPTWLFCLDSSFTTLGWLPRSADLAVSWSDFAVAASDVWTAWLCLSTLDLLEVRSLLIHLICWCHLCLLFRPGTRSILCAVAWPNIEVNQFSSIPVMPDFVTP